LSSQGFQAKEHTLRGLWLSPSTELGADPSTGHRVYPANHPALHLNG